MGKAESGPWFRRALSLAPVLALTTTACGGEPEGLSARQPAVVSGGMSASGPLVVSEGSSDAGLDALIAGPVTFRDGCLRVGGYPAIWPEGTTWDSHQKTLTLPNGVQVHAGEEVSGGGGYQTRPLSEYPTEVADVLEPCLGPTSEVAFFNRGHVIEKIT